ncbi:MAG: hypothetical protein ACE5EN_10585 [Nitrospinota bacterium]
MKKFLPRTVIVLGVVSFLNDSASDMITPLLPLFLTTTLGAGPAVVGLVEGVAEATASMLKLVSGRLADRGWNIKWIVIGGFLHRREPDRVVGDCASSDRCAEGGKLMGFIHRLIIY